MNEERSAIIEHLCAFHKLDRDQALTEFHAFVPLLSQIELCDVANHLFGILSDPNSSWEKKHGCLLGFMELVPLLHTDDNKKFLLELREFALKYLEDSEVRVRISSGELLGIMTKCDCGDTYRFSFPVVKKLILENLNEERNPEEFVDEQALETTPSILHDTAGWRNLETSLKCLEHLVDGCGDAFPQVFSEDLLIFVFSTLKHTNRFVRETGFYLCSAIFTHIFHNDVAYDEVVLKQHGSSISDNLAGGLADNWSQVRLAASRATRSAILGVAPELRVTYFIFLYPRICLNRYYLAEGVRLYSQQLWKDITGMNGRVLVEKYMEYFVKYYCGASAADNHAVREAACSCIAELALKINKEAVQPHVQNLFNTLCTCFEDDSWPVRDSAGVACGNLIICFPDDSQSIVDKLYPLFFRNLQDSILSVRQGAAIALANVAKAYRDDALSVMLEKMDEGFKGVEKQPIECEPHSDLEAGLTTYGVAKSRRDNDMELHTNRQMYSCGSLAPKMGRGGGCSSANFQRPSQPWELCDGCFFLLAELSKIQDFSAKLTPFLKVSAESLKFKHYTAHLSLYGTCCKVLPIMAKGFGKRLFKQYLHLYFDMIFYSLQSKNDLAEAAARDCINSLSEFIGPNILRGRVEEHNPMYVRFLADSLPMNIG